MNAAPRTPLARLFAYGRARRGQVRRGLFYSVVNRVLDIAPPLLIGLAVDVVTNAVLLAQWEGSAADGPPPASSLAWVGDGPAQLWFVVGLSIVVWVLESLFDYVNKLTWRNLAQTVQHDLRLDAYAHVQGLEMGFFEDAQTGGLMSVLNDDVNQLERFLDGGVNTIVQMLTSVCVIAGFYFYFEPRIAVIAMLPMPFVIGFSFWFQKRLAPRYAAVRAEVGDLNADLAGNLGGIATIKSYAAERREAARIGERSERYRERNRLAIRWSSAFAPLIRMVILVGFTTTMLYGGFLALNQELAVGVYATIVFLTQRLLWPLTQLGETFDLYQRAMASTTRILDLLDTAPAIVGGERTLPVGEVRGDVAFEDVHFSYPSSGPVLQGLTLEAPAGSTVAIVGATGSGKTTLMKLLLRFYDPTAGRVTLDGIEIRELTLPDLRSAVALVSQDVFLFHGTVRENIAYGRPDATQDEIEEAARLAEAHDFVTALSDGYDTIVGERGQKLSGGQRQRLSIARAILKDAPVLVFDEATSSVDNETEAAIQRSLERVSVGRTTVVIAHRLSTVRKADRIHVLVDGAIAESGTHDELVRSGGPYASLWSVQTGEASL